jgi:hypothetical protein
MDLEAIYDRAEELSLRLTDRLRVDRVQQRETGSCYFRIGQLDASIDDWLDYHNCVEVRVADHPQGGRPQVGFDVDASLPLETAVEQILAAAAAQFSR